MIHRLLSTRPLCRYRGHPLKVDVTADCMRCPCGTRVATRAQHEGGFLI